MISRNISSKKGARIREIVNPMHIRRISHSIQPAIDKASVKKIHSEILSIVGKRSPTYYSFDQSSPNFLKINNIHPGSVVTGNFLQYNFFPWNTESEAVFQTVKEQIKTLIELTNTYCLNKYKNDYQGLTGLDSSNLYNDRYFIRVAYQSFPINQGFLSIHRDPTGVHQICAPIISLSPKKEQGLYYIWKDKYHNVQKLMDYGDTIYFDSSRLHGVVNDLVHPFGTEHLLISAHSYHKLESFEKSYLE